MKTIATQIEFTQPEHKRVVSAGAHIACGVRVSFRSLCKRLVMMATERIEEQGK